MKIISNGKNNKKVQSAFTVLFNISHLVRWHLFHPCSMPYAKRKRAPSPPPSVSMSGNDGALSLCNCTLYGRYDDGLLSPCLPRHNCNSRVVSFSATEMTFAQQTTCFRLRSLELMR